MRASIERLERRGDELHVRGYAYIHGVGAGEEGAQRVKVARCAPGRLARVRLLTSALRLRARSVAAARAHRQLAPGADRPVVDGLRGDARPARAAARAAAGARAPGSCT